MRITVVIPMCSMTCQFLNTVVFFFFFRWPAWAWLSVEQSCRPSLTCTLLLWVRAFRERPYYWSLSVPSSSSLDSLDAVVPTRKTTAWPWRWVDFMVFTYFKTIYVSLLQAIWVQERGKSSENLVRGGTEMRNYISSSSSWATLGSEHVLRCVESDPFPPLQNFVFAP